MTPGATHVMWTRWLGLNPARSSQRPTRRIFGLIRPFQMSPSASIFNERTGECGSIDLRGSVCCTTLLSPLNPHWRRGRRRVTAHKSAPHIMLSGVSGMDRPLIMILAYGVIRAMPDTPPLN